MSDRFSNTLFFHVRHGRAEANAEKIYRSWSNDRKAQLSDDGRRDAEEAGEFLIYTGVPVELIIADSLDRTQETSEILASVLDVENLQFVRALHPLNMGDYTLESKEEHPVDAFIEHPERQIPGGESVDDFNARMMMVFPKIIALTETLPGGRIVVVGHGSTVSFLHNQMFNGGQPRIGYEGLVDPGGVISVTEDGLLPLTKVRGKLNQKTPNEKLTAREAGYMELDGAEKDAGCLKVFVPGGVSGDLGCCNLFEPKDEQVTRFRCGDCEYLTEGVDGSDREADA